MRRTVGALMLLALAAAGQPPPPAGDAAPSPAWLARPAAALVLLDKISARPTPATVKVGQSTTFGTLAIAVRACVVRPPDQPADAAAFLDITDVMSAAPLFHGWMIVSAPALSMLQHAVYDVRVAGCQG